MPDERLVREQRSPDGLLDEPSAATRPTCPSGEANATAPRESTRGPTCGGATSGGTPPSGSVVVWTEPIAARATSCPAGSSATYGRTRRRHRKERDEVAVRLASHARRTEVEPLRGDGAWRVRLS